MIQVIKPPIISNRTALHIKFLTIMNKFKRSYARI